MIITKETIANYYFLKEELVAFCKKHSLPSVGSKAELTNRISLYLNTGRVEVVTKSKKKAKALGVLTKETLIEENFVCTQSHRAFFEEEIGKSFKFNVAFQKWLKSNAGKTYNEAIQAYYQVINSEEERSIVPQFDYNTYIRDFFRDNKGSSLKEAIACWNYKKTLPFSHKYERADLKAIKNLLSDF